MTLADEIAKLNELWADVIALEATLDALDKTAEITVDMESNQMEQAAESARQQYVVQRAAYLALRQPLETTLELRRNAIANRLMAARNLAFDTYGVTYLQPDWTVDYHDVALKVSFNPST